MCVYLIIQSIFPATVLVSYPSNERTTCSSKNSWNSVTIERLIKDGMIIHEPNKQLDLIIIGVVPPSSFNKNIPLTIWSLLVLLVRVLCTPSPPSSWKHQK